MLGTPREILGEGYPLPTDEARAQTSLVWNRAFKLHRETHDFTKGPREKVLLIHIMRMTAIATVIYAPILN